ncbi:DUF2171 domain-containing protein [Solirubrobacter sp. CPCC 204708]|uniref:DUF2171 domain-containing protein n=1 Tax=Solirubrobacter deserti TaxID=2282478 RepID=A0ABT4RQB1_9ACTN|nr:DUF2171 domain-containing protein [Solirubrobacter deserti]MBE2320510.1 DUF2171 domain-containing protein [Solirubrobacter deserti]MDA0140756.1 DUF2171 domain-containing protein [Solirubrobacter deserti]
MTMASYYTLEAGATVRASDGTEVGKVEHVLADSAADIFDGLVIDVRTGPGGHRFVDAPQVAQMDEDGGVTLTLSEREVEQLPEPAENPATMSAEPADLDRSELHEKLRRAWEVISGKG